MDRAIRRARRYAAAGLPIPLDLYAELVSYGVVVDDIERNPNG